MTKESAAAWRLWVENPCYREFEEMIDEIVDESVADEDRVSTADLSVQIIAENRGVRKGLAILLRRIEENVLRGT